MSLSLKDKTTNIGLGCVTFGREIDQSESFNILDYAFARGINFFDTASAYGDGASENIIGKWISSRRPPAGSVIIATKILPPFDPHSIIDSVSKSQERLGTHGIDILYLHRWDPTFETTASLETFEDLIRKGQIGKLGASNFTSEQLKRALHLQQLEGFETLHFVQNNRNLAVSDIDNDFRSICIQHEIEIITYSPLGAGFLTGKHLQGVIAGSRFDMLPAHQNIYFQETAQKRLSKLLEVAARIDCTPSHLALAWALHQPGISKVLVGARSVQHINQAIAALDFNDPTIFSELADTRSPGGD